MGKITLIGCAHSDVKGEQRLDKLLRHVQPEIITAESSEHKRKVHARVMKILCECLEQKGLNPDNVKEFCELTIGDIFYEYKACERYAKNNNIPLYELDKPYLAQVEKKICRTEIKEYKELETTNQILEDVVREERKKKKDSFATLCYDLKYYDFSFLLEQSKIPDYIMGERDAYMAEKLNKIIIENHDKKIVHVGGALHMLESKHFVKPSLYMLLSENNPRIKVYYLPYADTVV